MVASSLAGAGNHDVNLARAGRKIFLSPRDTFDEHASVVDD
jgi:hypothetical protein